MSVTFSFNGMPTRPEEFECPYCHDGEECSHCKGTGVELIDMPIHEVNWANGNANTMLAFLEIPQSEGYGEISQSEFTRLLSTCIRLLNTKDMDCVVSEAFSEGRVHFAENTGDSWMRRVREFQALVLAAKDAGQDIHFG
jgi:hypothetical protein